MSVKERLIGFLKYKRIGQKKFAQSIGMSDGYVNAIRKSIQPKTLSSISNEYPELDITWLLTGEGSMLKEVKKEDQLLEGFSDNVLSYLKEKTEDKVDDDLRSMNVGDLLFLQMLEKLKQLEKRVKQLEAEIEEIKKRVAN